MVGADRSGVIPDGSVTGLLEELAFCGVDLYGGTVYRSSDGALYADA